MSKDQVIRGVLFYAAVAVFLSGLPFILSSALGYKFNPHSMKFTKTGLISIITDPEGALIYFDGILLKDKTPASIRELLPGRYDLRLELDDYNFWSGEVFVEAGQVTRLENIILFPVRPNLKKLNKEKISGFWVDEERGRIYYFDSRENLVYTSGLKGEDFQDVGMLPEITPPPKRWKVSPDKKKAVFFNANQAVVAEMEGEEGRALPDAAVVLNFSGRRLLDIFWHSDSFHLVAVTDKGVEVVETGAAAIPVTLLEHLKGAGDYYYNEKEDALYFLDYPEVLSSGSGDLFKLDLSLKSSIFQNLLRPKSDERSKRY